MSVARLDEEATVVFSTKHWICGAVQEMWYESVLGGEGDGEEALWGKGVIDRVERERRHASWVVVEVVVVGRGGKTA